MAKNGNQTMRMDYSCPRCGHQGPHNSVIVTENPITVYNCSVSACGKGFTGEQCTRPGCPGIRSGVREIVEVKRNVKDCAGCGQRFFIAAGLDVPVPYPAEEFSAAPAAV